MEPLKTSSSHPKIKPVLIQTFASGKNQNQKNIQKHSTSSSKQFRIQDLSQLKKPFTKTLVSQHKLSDLGYDFKPQFFPQNIGLPTSVTSFFSQIKNLRSLTTFHLKSLHSSHLHTQTCLNPLMMSLASLKNLSNLKIIFVSRFANPELLKMLFKYLQRIKTLTNISLTFWVAKKPSTSHLDVLSSGLRKLLQLRSLDLSLDAPPELQEYLINKLALALPKLPFLTKTGFRFYEDPIASDAISNLFSSFKNMKILSDISLTLQSQPANNCKEPISQGLFLLDPSRIRKLDLQLYQHFDDNSLIQFSEALKRFTSLDILQFGLCLSQKISEEGLAALISALNSLISLSSLTILWDAVNCEKFIKGISVPFKYLKNLANLNLQILGEVSHEAFQHLFSNLRLLKSLRFLTLAYTQKGIEDKTLQTLAESLKEIQSLQDLSLDFSRANLITNQGVESLACSIKALRNLSSLKIWLSKNGNLDNQAVSQIARILRDLPSLYSVDFNFLLCPKITSFNELLRVLKQAKSIGEIALSLPTEVIKSHEIIQLMEDKFVKRMTSF